MVSSRRYQQTQALERAFVFFAIIVAENIFEMKSEILIIRDRSDILLENRLSGATEPFDKLRTCKDILLFMGNPLVSYDN